MRPVLKTLLATYVPAKGYTTLETIQTLWSGYGKIERIGLSGGAVGSVVVKSILLDQAATHPRGWSGKRSHARKVKSYEVETEWYKQWSARCSDHCRIPKFLGATEEGNNRWIVMEDLNAGFPLRKTQVTLDEVKVCLSWLAHFHATFLCEKPDGLWQIGTYWHLDTRLDEWDKIKHAELKAKAAAIDEVLNNSRYQTIVHGDAKLANFCFSEDGKRVAAVDFQYVGGGCGVKDVAYFLGSCLSGEACERHERELLDVYFTCLKQAIESQNKAVDFDALEAEWRKMYPIAWTDFTRFMLGWMPTHQKVHGYSLRLMGEVLRKLEP